MIKEQYTPKHSEASQDYKAAYDIVMALGIGEAQTALPDNIKVFRKYIYDLALKQDKEMATRMLSDKVTIRVSRLS